MSTSLKRLPVALAAVLALGLAAAGTASASGDFYNNHTGLISRDNGRYIGQLETYVWSGGLGGARSIHVHIFGPGIDYNTPTEYMQPFHTYRAYLNVNKVFNNGDRICAEGWYWTGSAYRSIGLPCFTISAT